MPPTLEQLKSSLRTAKDVRTEDDAALQGVLDAIVLEASVPETYTENVYPDGRGIANTTYKVAEITSGGATTYTPGDFQTATNKVCTNIATEITYNVAQPPDVLLDQVITELVRIELGTYQSQNRSGLSSYNVKNDYNLARNIQLSRLQ